MFTSSFHRHTLAALLALSSFALFPAATLAGHSWGNYHWARTGNPFTLSLGNNVSPTWDPYLATASARWNESSVLQTADVAGRAKPRTCKPSAGRVEVCSERYGFNGWLGIAQIWISGSHITQGVTKVNDSYFNTAKYNTPGWRNLVMCQEIGHTFGLDHQDENFSNPNLGTCMDYTSNPDDPDGPQSNEYPNQHDYEQLEAIYAHVDTVSTVAQASETGGAASPSAAAEEPLQAGTAQWGRLIRSTNRGRTERFELDLGAGQKVFTFVIWADPEGEPGAGQGRGRR
jgi:hypothetical protein